LDAPDRGRIRFGERDVTDVPTEQRNAVLCFQSYALFPHMTLEQNVGFGLEVRGVKEPERTARVRRALGLVQLSDLGQRKPAELSGGQQQRVALARALAVEPQCLLLDEPLSNLDAKLRHEMRSEIQRVCKSSGHTTVYVTHDQKEALSIADRIAVMHRGRIVQVGTPAELYGEPSSSFVAEFISHANLLPGKVIERSERGVRVSTAIGPLFAAAPRAPAKGEVILSIRPDQIRIVRAQPAAEANVLQGSLTRSGFLGESSEHWLQVGGMALRLTHSPPLFEPPGTLSVEISPHDLKVHET
jgi:iron(III) transport system ATP-binding protein